MTRTEADESEWGVEVAFAVGSVPGIGTCWDAAVVAVAIAAAAASPENTAGTSSALYRL